MSKEINTVIFDFDGTIADTNQLIINSWQYTYRKFRGREESEDKIISTFGEPLILSMEREFPEIGGERAAEIYREYQLDKYEDEVDIFPGVKELLIELKDLGYRLAVATSRFRHSTMIGLNKFGITELFDVIVTCEDSKAHKPNPEPVLLTLEKMGVSKEHAIMIGDSRLDIQCAHNAGIEAALVDWTLTLKGVELSGIDVPELYIKTPKDLIDYLEKNN